jgi:hypothetical protein
VRGMTFKKKLLTIQPLIELAGRRLKRCSVTSEITWVRPILMPEVPGLDGYLADSMPSGHTR